MDTRFSTVNARFIVAATAIAGTSSDPSGCSEKALGNAIRSVDQPLLTQMYLRQHTLREAATYGIESATKLAAK
jgi:hypothetical protein